MPAFSGSPFEIASTGLLSKSAFTTAVDGWITEAPVKPKEADRDLRISTTSGGGGWILPQLPVDLEPLAEQAAQMAVEPDFQKWVSTALSNTTEPLSNDFELADYLLRTIQSVETALVAKTVYLAASFAAVGLPSYLVGDSVNPFSSVVTAVYLDGAWFYADPNGHLPLGTHKPFTRENYFKVPDLPTPYVVKMKEQLDRQAKQLGEQNELLIQQQEHLSELSTHVEDLFGQLETAQLQAKKSRNMLKLVSIGVVIIGVIWLLTPKKDPED